VVLISGAGRGIGRAIALAFARQGASLALNDLTPINLDETIFQAQALNAPARSYVFDIARKMPVEEMVFEILSEWGRIDILINNAAVHPIVPLLEMDEWDVRRTLDVNLLGPFFLIQAVGRTMGEQGGGVIVNIAADLERAQGWNESAAFVASKMGLIGLTQAAAGELAGSQIRVHAICPGWIETESSTGKGAGMSVTGADIALGRPGRPEEVAELALYLCSPAAAHLSGLAINLDDGLKMLKF
jgi:3-oxoacyl-[acyl-carrier protein] reductase